MNQEETQDIDVNSDMTPEEAKASLGLATRLGEEMLIAENPPMEEGEEGGEETVETPEQPTEEKEPEVDVMGEIGTFRDEMTEELKSFKKEMKDGMKKQMEDIRQDIKDALTEEDAKE